MKLKNYCVTSVFFWWKNENSNLHGFEVHRPSSKGTKLLFQVIKAIMNQYIHYSIHKCVHILSKNAEGKTHDKSGSLLEELCQSKFSKVYAREKVFFIGFIWRLQTKVQHLDMSPAWPFETSIRMGWGLSRKNLANNGHSSWMKIAFLLLIKKECGIFVWNS